MATVSSTAAEIHYPDSDGKPLGETPHHIQNLFYVCEPLRVWFDDPCTLVAANMFVYYEEGNPWKHISPDVFVVRQLAAKGLYDRRKYLVWEEGKTPDLAIEVTSESTRAEDFGSKLVLYRDTLKVREYFLFDPFDEYLHPRLQGFRRVGADFVRIEPVAGRLPSDVLGLHLEGDGFWLRFFDPTGKRWLPIPPEIRDLQRATASALQQETEALRRETENLQRETEALQRETQARRQAEAEADRLRRELDELRKRLTNS